MTADVGSQASWRYFLQEYPRKTAAMIFFLFLAGVVESIGAVSLVPLLASLFDVTPATAPLLARITSAFESVGMPPTLEYMLVVLCAAMLLKSALTLLAYRQTGYIEAEISTRLRSSLLDNLLRANWQFFVTQPAGQLTYALSTETTQAGIALRVFCQMLSHVMQACAYLLAGFLLSWKVMLAAGVCGGAFFLAFRRLIQSVRSAGSRQVQALNSMTSGFTDALAAAKPLKIMGAESTYLEHIRSLSETYRAMSRRQSFNIGLLSSVQEPVLTVLLAGSIFVSLRLLKLDATTILATALFFQRSLSRFSTAQQSLQLFAGLEEVLLSLRRKISVMRSHRDPAGGTRRITLAKGLRLENVSFRYGEKAILNGLTLDIPVGRITGVCGPSGSGKTTLIDIITGLIAPQQGTVTVDGAPLEELDRQHWREQIGYVPQEVFLFNDTVRSNITLGRNHSDADIWAALDQAGAAGFVRANPCGLEAPVGEQGRGLSGGQRQRLMIARALLGKPRLLILDEATSGLDQGTEAEILAQVVALKRDMAILVVSHQQAVRSMCDQTIHFEAAP